LFLLLLVILFAVPREHLFGWTGIKEFYSNRQLSIITLASLHTFGLLKLALVVDGGRRWRLLRAPGSGFKLRGGQWRAVSLRECRHLTLLIARQRGRALLPRSSTVILYTWVLKS